MWQNRVGSPARHPPEIQNVHVDFAGTIAKRGRASHAMFHSLDGLEQLFGGVAPEDRHGGVPELRLILVTHRVGAVKGRHTGEARDAADLGESRLQVGAAVAPIGAKAEVGRTGAA